MGNNFLPSPFRTPWIAWVCGRHGSWRTKDGWMAMAIAAACVFFFYSTNDEFLS